MIKILGVMGSPRINGNTHILVSNIIDSAKRAGAKTEIILLKDYNINECDGCLACWKGEECVKMDDMNKIYPKIIQSDIIIFGTPVYFYGPTAIMKSFLDRFVYFNCPENRDKLRGKSAVIVIPFEEKNIETASPTIQLFEKSLDYLELRLIEKIIVPGIGKRGAVLKKESVIENAIKLGERLAKMEKKNT